MKKRIVLVGNAITADIFHAYLEADSRYEVVAATVDDAYVDGGDLKGLELVPFSTLSSRFKPGDVNFLMAMGYSGINLYREQKFHQIRSMGYAVESYVHPDAKIYTSNPLGEGSIVLGGAVIEPHAMVGTNAFIWCNATLAHHSRIGDHCWISSGAVVSGHAEVKKNSFIGVNATLVNKVTVGERCVVGAGALITKDTTPSSVHLMRSAEVLRFKSEEYDQYFGI